MATVSRASRYRLALLASLLGILILLLIPRAFRPAPFFPAAIVALLSVLILGVGPAILAQSVMVLATLLALLARGSALADPGTPFASRLVLTVALFVLVDAVAWRLERSRRAGARRERALWESETRYRHILEQASDGIVLASSDGRLMLANQRICEMLGYSEAELLQVPVASLFAGVRQDETPLAWEELEGSSVILRERELRRKDGSTLRTELSVRRTADGCAQAIVRDITERRRAEAAVRAEHAAVAEREEQLERITAAVPGVVYQFVVAADGTGRFAFVSERARELFGVAAQEIMADTQRLRAVVDPDDYSAMTVSFRQATRSREPFSYDFRVATPQGQPRWLRAIATASAGKDPGSVVWFGVVVNITEQKRLEEELRQSQKMDSLGRLAGGVAHDFNNLLTIIRGYADVLSSELSPEDPRRAEVREIRGAADRATSLTRQLLAMSRRQVLVPREVDLNVLVRDMERMLRRVIGEDIRIVTGLAAELGWVRADPGQLEQVLLNLAVNARDAMPAGGTLTIATGGMQVVPDRDEPQTRGVPPGEYVVLRVADTGVGMDRKTLGKIFEPFFTTKPPGKGTGLGLSTVYGIVQQSNGAVTVESEPGSGSTFRVFLPRIARPVRPGPAVAATASPLARRARILLVDDEENVRQLTARILEQYGYEVTVARDGAEVLARLAAGAAGVDALVSDVRMAGLSGTELVARLRAAHNELPVLLLSGYTGEDLDGAIRRDASCAFLEKPFSPDALVTALEELLADAKPPATAG